MSLRLAFGVRRENDNACKMDDFMSSGMLTYCELVASKDEKDEPRDKYCNKIASQRSKDIPRNVHVFLNRLYRETISPLQDGFLHEMKNAMRNVLFCNRDLFDKVVAKQFSPSENDIKELTSFTSTTLQSESLTPKKFKFAPINVNICTPPTKN